MKQQEVQMADEQKQEMSPREKLRMERMARMRRDQNVARVRVVPRDDEMRSLLAHPVGGIGFLPTGSVEWPNDSFTQRRIEDGSVTLESNESNAPNKPNEPGGPQGSRGSAAGSAR